MQVKETKGPRTITIEISETEAGYLNTALVEGPDWISSGEAGKFFEKLFEKLDKLNIPSDAYEYVGA